MAIRKRSKKQEEEANLELEKRFSRLLEETKMTNDYLKHIGTLDTGSIVILATFSQNLKPLGEGTWLLLAAVVCLFISLWLVVASETFVIFFLSRASENINDMPTKRERSYSKITIYLAYLTFFLGILNLGLYIFKGLSIF